MDMKLQVSPHLYTQPSFFCIYTLRNLDYFGNSFANHAFIVGKRFVFTWITTVSKFLTVHFDLNMSTTSPHFSSSAFSSCRQFLVRV